MATKIHDVPETTSIADRRLRDGTLLRYQLKVLQQPQRARACGMGAKSHADRRPVDPPPVVELKIFSGEEKSDITFSHNSNFFLFETLEQARPIAQGRGMPSPAPAPVLTGVPVSGMAYLDRPNPAGYFIFPDLSVRHEGKYRLRFSLFEETKDRDEMVPQREGEPREFAAQRVEVKSMPFTVFSAKKFPGLAESTALSRIVAEQGCRVRIRRDVRMRRRNDRSGRDGDSELDETAMLRGQRRSSPDGYDDMRNHGHQAPQHPHGQPQQSPHNGPPAHLMQRSGSIDRRRSGSDASISSIPDGPPAPRYDERYAPRQEHSPYGAPQPAPPSHNHLTFGNGGNISHHPAPPPNVHQAQVYNHHAPPQPTRYQAPPAPQPQHTHQSPHMPPAPRPQGLQNNQYAPQPYHRDNSMRRGSTSQEFQAPVAHNRRESDGPYRQAHPQYKPQTASGPPSHYHSQVDSHAYNAPVSYQAPPPPPPPQSQPQYHPPAPIHSSAPTLPSIRLPPLAINSENRLLDSRNNLNSPSTLGPSAALPSPGAYTSSNTHHTAPHAASSYTYPPQPYVPASIPKTAARPPPPPPPPPAAAAPVAAAPEPVRGTKREWGSVFNASHLVEPLHNGKRPDTISETSGYGADAVDDDEDDDDFDIGKLKMTYRRADGEEIVRRLPMEP
ncbi:velvet factor-domain-containing protein [Peziza echinospora]|nr:velvet factor-domain-containing protein [Peziza echinospora]